MKIYYIMKKKIRGAGIKDAVDDLIYNAKSKIFDIKSGLRRSKYISNKLDDIGLKTLSKVAAHMGYGKKKRRKKRKKNKK